MKKRNSPAALFLGILAGFTFLLSFFFGIGAVNSQLFVIAVFFAIVSSAIGLLLFGERKSFRK